MEILQKDNGPKGKFYVEQNGELLSEMAYVWAGKDRMIIEHTDVSETLAGKQRLSITNKFSYGS